MSKIWDPLADMPDLQGKIALVTGGNAGIGYATVKFLALGGAKVYLAARSESKAIAAIERLCTENPAIKGDQIVWLPLDLSDPKAVIKAVNEMKRKEEKLDILINNAGIGLSDFQVNDAGWEMVMAVCHVGHFVLTLGLLPLLKKATSEEDADVRVVTVSSIITTALVPIDFDFGFDSPTFLTDHKTFTSLQWKILSKLVVKVDMPRYAMAKTANVLFAQELQHLLDAKGIPILSMSLHPGGVGTEGARAVFTNLVKPLIWLNSITTDQGAVTSLFAATAKVVRENEDMYGGKYLLPFGEVSPTHPVTKDERQVRGLWQNTLAAANECLVKNGLEPVRDV